MRILAISHLFPSIEDKRYGIFSARQLQAMHRLGAEITVLVPVVWCPRFLRRFRRWRKYNHKRPLYKFEGLETISIPYPRPPGNWFNRWAGLVLFQTMRRKVLKLHEKMQFDVIYSIDLFPDGDAAARLGKYLKIPATCLCIGVDVNVTAISSRTIYRHFASVIKALDGTAACGKIIKDRIDSVADRNSLCVYGTLDLKKFSPTLQKSSLRKMLGLPQDKIIALFAGYIEERKGIYELVDAFSRIRRLRSDVMLIMCGDGRDEEGLRQIIKRRNLVDIVSMVGQIEPEQMNMWMQASDLFILPSHTEGVPNAVMEAMACGLPVIATSVGGVPDAIGDCEGVILIAPRDVDSLREAILKLASDAELRARMGVESREKAQKDFGVDRNAKLVLDYLSGVIRENRYSR